MGARELLAAIATWAAASGLPALAATLGQWARAVELGQPAAPLRLEAVTAAARLRRLVELCEASGMVPPPTLIAARQAYVLAGLALAMAGAATPQEAAEPVSCTEAPPVSGERPTAAGRAIPVWPAVAAGGGSP